MICFQHSIGQVLRSPLTRGLAAHLLGVPRSVCSSASVLLKGLSHGFHHPALSVGKEPLGTFLSSNAFGKTKSAPGFGHNPTPETPLSLSFQKTLCYYITPLIPCQYFSPGYKTVFADVLSHTPKIKGDFLSICQLHWKIVFAILNKRYVPLLRGGGVSDYCLRGKGTIL